MFLDKVGQIKTGVISVASRPILATLGLPSSRARVAIEICVKSGTVYLGGEDVSASNGIPLASGSNRLIPVNNGGAAQIYLAGSGSVILAEYTK